VPVTADVVVRGGLLRRDHGKAHGTGLADALLAATAELLQARLVTLNRKQFPMLPDVPVPYRK
jgi:predicted nucleic acid-binding protein